MVLQAITTGITTVLSHPMVNGAAIGIFYSGATYLQKMTKKDENGYRIGEAFDKYKLVATALVGAAVGAAAMAKGSAVTETSITSQMILYGFFIPFVDKGIKTVARYLGWLK